jgi:hypothetical protein
MTRLLGNKMRLSINNEPGGNERTGKPLERLKDGRRRWSHLPELREVLMRGSRMCDRKLKIEDLKLAVGSN